MVYSSSPKINLQSSNLGSLRQIKTGTNIWGVHGNTTLLALSEGHGPGQGKSSVRQLQNDSGQK